MGTCTRIYHPGEDLKVLRSAHSAFLLRVRHNEQRTRPCTALTNWFDSRDDVFTARYEHNLEVHSTLNSFHVSGRCRPFTTEDRDRYRLSSCEIYGRQSGTGTDFSSGILGLHFSLLGAWGGVVFKALRY